MRHVPKSFRPLILSEPQTVRCGKAIATLTRLQFTLLAYLLKHGKATYNQLRKRVWGKPVSDHAIGYAAIGLCDALIGSGIMRETHKQVGVYPWVEPHYGHFDRVELQDW